jgi:hypothetical protein
VLIRQLNGTMVFGKSPGVWEKVLIVFVPAYADQGFANFPSSTGVLFTTSEI